jgi:hypothetical protein
VEVDDEFLRNYVSTMDSLLFITREKLIYETLLNRTLVGWEENAVAARLDPKFLGEKELELAEIQEMRNRAVEMLERLRRGETVQMPNRPVN